MEFRILGPLEVVDDGRAVAVPGAKPRTLLATLARHAGQTLSDERLIDELWGERPPATAAAALQMHVSALRKALGRDQVVRRGGGYALAADGHEVDARRFEELVAQARAAAPAEAAPLLREALALWRGEPEVDARDLVELRSAALEQRIAADLELGRAAAAIPELQALVAAEPLSERLRALLILALYRVGRQVDALAEYSRIRQLLVEELGIEPGPELQRLQVAILAHDPALAAAAPAAPAPAPPSLPAAATPLVGRGEELTAVAELFAAGARLVTLTGPGGIGKTSLALEVARSVDPRAAFVPLAELEDPALVPAAVAEALGLDVAGRSPEEAVRARLLVDGGTLVLDNFEQLLDAAPFVSWLLAAAENVRILVTSRALLRIAGEREFAVPPLRDAVELFLARTSTPVDDLDSVREICERLDNIPLAVELAAARTTLLAPSALLERLQSRLDVLTSGPRDAPERQRTMRGAIDWSFRLLEEPERTLFTRLAVFHGGASLAAVEDVCGEGIEVLDVLGSLIEKSLVQRRDDAREPRFAMLDTIHEYAEERLFVSGEEGALRDRQLEWAVALVAEAEAGLEGAQQDEWFDRLATELPNLRAALAHALQRADADAAVQLAGRMRRFWQVHGHLEEGRRWLERALELPAGPSDAHARAWTGLGMLRGEQGDYAGARVAFERSLTLARELDDPRRLVSALNNLGNVAFFLGETEAAEELYGQSLEQSRALGSDHTTAISLENLGCVRLVQGDVDDAVDLLREAVELTRRLGELRAVASTEAWLGRALVLRGDTDGARPLLANSLHVARRLHHRQGVATAIGFTAAYAVARDEARLAARLAGAVETLWPSTGAAPPPDYRALAERTAAHLRAVLDAGELARETAAGRALDEGAAAALAEETLARP